MGSGLPGGTNPDDVPDRIRIRCEAELFLRWRRLYPLIAPGGDQAEALAVLLDVFEQYPTVFEYYHDPITAPDDMEVRGIEMPPRLAGRWDHWAKTFDSDADALRALLDIVDDNPDLTTPASNY